MNMNWLKRLLIASALTSAMISSLMASSPSYQTFWEGIDPLFAWNQGHKHFTTSLYPHAKRSSQNFIFSPISLQLCLAMTAEIALNKTQEEILKNGFLPEIPHIRREGVAQILSQLNTGTATDGEPVQLVLANGAWLSSEFQLHPWFQTLFKDSYQATLNQANFRFASKDVEEEINDWVAEKTSNQILDLIPKGSLNSQTRLVLVNTLYMRAPWNTSFNSEKTYEDLFYGMEKTGLSIPYMQQTGRFGYLDEAEYEVIELPFRPFSSTATALSLFVVLPKEGYFLEEIENQLTTRRLDHWISDMETQLLDLSLPKFKVASSLNAKEIFKKLGILRPFSSQDAEFDLPSESERIVITDIVHQAVFEVDEQGGTGSAGTGVVIGITSCPETKEVKVNRPFLIFVADKTTGILLFAGHITHPYLNY
jgi:serpin B